MTHTRALVRLGECATACEHVSPSPTSCLVSVVGLVRPRPILLDRYEFPPSLGVTSSRGAPPDQCHCFACGRFV
jgi:hypothetical protein